MAAALVVALSPGCTETKSRLEVISDQAEERAAVEMSQDQASLLQLPASSTPPQGMPSGVWTDLHWLPPTVVGVNGTPPGEQPLLARWVFSQSFADHESCQEVERGLVGGYGVEWEKPPQSFVFFGTAAFKQIETCAIAFMRGLGGSARMQGQALHLVMDGVESKVVFARRGDQLVAVVDDGRMGAVGDAYPGRLKKNAALVELLEGLDPTESVWAVSTLDMTRVPLGVPSRGYVMHATSPGQLKIRFVFGSIDEAKRAYAATGPFFEELETFLGASLHPTAALSENGLLATADLTVLDALGPEKSEALRQKTEDFAAGRRQPPDL